MPWPVHPTGFFGARGDSDTYRIERSLRFNSADSAYLSRTPASAGNRKTWTWSGWVKRGLIDGNFRTLFGVNNGTGSNYFALNITTSETLACSDSASYYRFTTQVFRDPSAWYHIVCSVDTTLATGSDRIKFYVNGLQITSFSISGDPSQNSDLGINQAAEHGIGRIATDLRYFDGYLTEINFIDGQALTPSSFGETDAITGRWKAKAYSGTYGTNGFYLKFADNSGTTSTTLGKDSSGNGNNWTPNNFSVTAGAGNDSLVDSPTNYGTDIGLGGEVRGNYATLNPLSITSGSFVQGNLRYTGPSGWRRANGTIAVSSGKWYWEVTLGNAPFGTGVSNSFNAFGWGLSTVFNSSDSTNTQTNAIALADNQHYKNFSGSATSLGTSFASGDVLGCAVDLGANTFTFYRNGSQLVTGTIGGTAGRELVPIIISYDGTYGVMDCNFGQRPFAYTAPSGFKALCTQNLPQPTIQKPSTAMDVVTYTGTGASQSISSLGFLPDLVWIKGRSGATDHAIYDSVRGTTLDLASNLTSAETTQSQGVTAFNSNGFTIGTLAKLNTNTSTYVGWSWDAGSTNSTNTSGSITSTVRVNPQAGFSIVSYTGTGANATVGHGLGVAPKMIIARNRNSSVAQNWQVYHSNLTSASFRLRLNTTDAQDSVSGIWNSTNPTSSVFSIGTETGVNESGKIFIAYCFSEIEGYSRFGSYTGNGSADGPFVWCGFRPKYVIVKGDSVSNWNAFDASRSQTNPTQTILRANLANAEIDGVSATAGVLDFLSNGFKLRGAYGDTNANSTTFIFAAFAESPFKYARAR